MMMKLLSICIGLMVMSMGGFVQATLLTIGSATYNGSAYNLIWDNDNGHGTSVVWLDYTKSDKTWLSGKSWASNLKEELNFNFDSNYSVTWTDDDWRLPRTEDGPVTYRPFDSSSEMGHLYFEELENWIGPSLLETGEFENLEERVYWSSTSWGNGPAAWTMDMWDGYQTPWYKGLGLNAMALRGADVIETSEGSEPVPEPTTMLLFGSGLITLAGRKFRRNKK